MKCESQDTKKTLPHKWEYVGRGKRIDPRTGFYGYDYECDVCHTEANEAWADGTMRDDPDGCRPIGVRL